MMEAERPTWVTVMWLKRHIGSAVAMEIASLQLRDNMASSSSQESECIKDNLLYQDHAGQDLDPIRYHMPIALS